ncbi:MAG: hypothetical protein L6Q81_07490 [Bacteroidia bacterium]|nr:hypothetical protein [Bacteroidia bacterium]
MNRIVLAIVFIFSGGSFISSDAQAIAARVKELKESPFHPTNLNKPLHSLCFF